MRKALLLSVGVGATLVLAVLVGAAAANTGAPVFYDARYPAPASTTPEQYEVGEGEPDESVSSGAIGEGDADGTVPPAPPGSAPAPPATPRATTKPGAPATPPTATPTPTPTPDPDDPASDDPTTDRPPSHDTGPSDDEKATWLAFQQIVRECMADAGQEYLYWEWWNPGPDTSNRFPAMPADLGPDAVAAWNLALNGDSPAGDAYRWQDAGCWGEAVQVTGGTH